MSQEFTQVLGIRFYTGDINGLLDLTARGGLVAAPSAPVLARLATDPDHWDAVHGCDFAITDSGYMVLLWALLRGRGLPRISGLRFLQELLGKAALREPGATLWVMPSQADADANRAWLAARGIAVGPEAAPVAPHYPAGPVTDPDLLARIEALRPRYVVLCIGGGVQERLGHYLRARLGYRPAILCTGAAIAFLSGRQVRIPGWADRFLLGWLVRSLADPLHFPARLMRSVKLAWLIAKYGEKPVPRPG
jgi:N-acetylglucosaminyldiphosphoundecaprenol N-acetyl-beta-D-mannosaminyltransferase